MNIKKLEEFQYILGDCRTHFFKYLLTLPNFVSYYDSQADKENSFNQDAIFSFVCNPVEQKRMIKPPVKKYLEQFTTVMKNGPITLIPLIIKNKLNCKKRNGARHMNIIMYNKLTHEVERIDLRKYHINGFSLKLYVKHLVDGIIPKYINKIDEEAVLTTDLDVPLQFVSKIKAATARDAFPVFLLTYLHMRSQYPGLPSEEVTKKVMKASIKTIQEHWESYVEFRLQQRLSCMEGMIENPESRKCLKPLSKTLAASIADKPVHDCKDGYKYHPLIGRCVKREKYVDVDILMDDAMSSQYNLVDNLTHVDRKVETTIGIFNYLIKKYHHVTFLYRKDIPLEKLKKAHTRINWEYNDDTRKFDLSFPERFWEMWSEAQYDPSIRFIIVLLHLRSKGNGLHANVLIYDKSTNEIERFDGLGPDVNPLYKVTKFDKTFQKLLKERVDIFPSRVTYLTPLDYCPRMPVFQSKELDELPGKDMSGNCAVWRLWYVDVRLANPHLNRKDLVKLASKKLENTGSLYKFIKMYQSYLLQHANK